MVKLFGELVSAFSWEVWSWRSSSSFAPWQVRPNDSYALLQKNTPNGEWKNFNNACESGDGRFVTVSSKTRESRKVVKLVIEQEALQNRHNADPDLNGQWQVGPFFAVISVFWILQLFFQLSYLTHMQTSSMWPFHQLSCLSDADWRGSQGHDWGGEEEGTRWKLHFGKSPVLHAPFFFLFVFLCSFIWLVVWMKCASCSFSSALSVLASWYIHYSCFHKNCIDMHNCTKIKWEDLKFWRSASGV